MKITIIDHTRVIMDSMKVCWVEMTRSEAIATMISLLSQIQANHTDSGRIESPCTGQADLFTISVKPYFARDPDMESKCIQDLNSGNYKPLKQVIKELKDKIAKGDTPKAKKGQVRGKNPSSRPTKSKAKRK